MIPAPTTLHEAQRLRTLRVLLAVHGADDRVLETITSMACRLLDVPVAMVNVIDDTAQHSLASTGIDLPYLDRAEAVCPWTVATGDWFEVPDLQQDARFAGGVVDEIGMRSYHGSPVTSPDGLPLGALCAMDTRPRTLTADQRLIMQDLARLAADHVELVLRRAQDSTDPLRLPVRPVAAVLPAAPADPDPDLDLADGLATGQVVPFFQPIVATGDGQVLGVEALARWEHPSRGLLPPSAFLPSAEEGDVVVPLDATMLEEACHQVQSWRTSRPAAAQLELSVNISGRHLMSSALVDMVTGSLRRSGLPAHALTLELTETVLVEAGEGGADPAGLAALDQLRDLGVGLALDDFGTAYSTLAYLRRFPVTRLKIDRSFVAGLADGSRDALLVESVLQLADRLGLDVVAEGVETLDQLRVLRSLGCERAQGYYFLPPVSAEALELSGMIGSLAGAAAAVRFPRLG